jgi:hypothetical protein
MAMLKALPSVRVASFCEACDGSASVQAAAIAIRGACGGLICIFCMCDERRRRRRLGVAE